MPGDGSPFLSCPNIEDVEFGDDVTRVPAQLFHSCPSKLSNINWNHVTTIGVSSFRESGIQTFSLPDQITTLERYAIASCKQLEETVIPESIVTIGQQAFAECSKLHVVTFPDKTFTMNGQAFQKTGTDESVTTYDITIPDRAITIPAYCFQNSGITKLTLPASIPQIRDQAFAGCTNLAEVYAYGETIAPPANNNAFAGATYDSETGEKLTPNTYDVADLYVECIRLNGGYRYFKDIHARPRAAKEFTTFARNYQVEADDTHYQCYVATAYDAENHEVTVKKYAQLPMNAGAILWKATPADADDYLLTGRTAEGDADNIVSLADGDTNYLIGVLTDTTIQPQETIGGTEYTNFLLSNGAYYRFDNAGTLAAGKSYLHLPVSDYWGSVTENEARPLTLRFVDEAEAVVETRIADAETCRQLGLSDGRYYTPQGIRVAQPTRGGIYIHDGKTVVIK